MLGRVLTLPRELGEDELAEIVDATVALLRLPVVAVHSWTDLEEANEAERIILVTGPDGGGTPARASALVVQTASCAETLVLPPEVALLKNALADLLEREFRGSPLSQIASWSELLCDTPGTLMRFADGAQRAALKDPASSDTAIFSAGLASSASWLLGRVEPEIAEWVLVEAVGLPEPEAVLGTSAIVLGREAALGRAFDGGLALGRPGADGAPAFRRPLAALSGSASSEGGFSIDPPLVLARLQESLPGSRRDFIGRVAKALAKRAVSPYEEAEEVSEDAVVTPGDETAAGVPWRSPALAVEAFEQALGLLTREDSAKDWADAQKGLGLALQELAAEGDEGALERAIAAYQSALEIHTRESAPRSFGLLSNNLGSALQERALGERAENLAEAIRAHEDALTVYSKDTTPADWAMAKTNLGLAFRALPTGDRASNLARSLLELEAALTAVEGDASSLEWASLQNEIGVTLLLQTAANPAERTEQLRRALQAFEAALSVHTRHEFEEEWAMLRNNIGIAYQALPQGDRKENLLRASTAYEAALSVFETSNRPDEWATAQRNRDLCDEERRALLGEREGEDDALR